MTFHSTYRVLYTLRSEKVRRERKKKRKSHRRKYPGTNFVPMQFNIIRYDIFRRNYEHNNFSSLDLFFQSLIIKSTTRSKKYDSELEIFQTHQRDDTVKYIHIHIYMYQRCAATGHWLFLTEIISVAASCFLLDGLRQPNLLSFRSN